MQPIIRVANLGKRYRIGHRESYRTLRESLVAGVAAPFRRVASAVRGNRDAAPNGDGQVWALRDLSFEVEPGEVLGIVGRNGAGKSTLLKVLSRITEPTTGRVELYGRVGSLLEVGTGFHPELTGRENIFLSGAILGMRRAEIVRKFDEMVAFAEVEKFIDTPVKHFSSGMYVRLAFAVAAHLEPEILLVDEVLAVGDAAFQKKCLGKMGDVAKEGRTVLFVSHNMAAVESLCSSCLLIRNGRLDVKADASEVVTRYMRTDLGSDSGARSLADHPGRRHGSHKAMTAVELRSTSEGPAGTVRMSAPLTVAVTYSAPTPIRPVLGLTVKTSQGAPVFCVSDRFSEQLAGCDPAADGVVTCTIDKLPLMPGTYVIDLWLGDFRDQTRDLDVVNDAISFDVLAADMYGTGRLPSVSHGPVFCAGTFSLVPGLQPNRRVENVA